MSNRKHRLNPEQLSVQSFVIEGAGGTAWEHRAQAANSSAGVPCELTRKCSFLYCD